MSTGGRLGQRILLFAPLEGDANLTRSVLAEAGMPCQICRDLIDLTKSFEEGAGALLLTEEVFAAGAREHFVEALSRQPVWSEVPIVLLADRGANSPAAVLAMELVGNVTVLERPVRVTTLVSALRTALKARQRQYELRHRIEERRASEQRFRALVSATSYVVYRLGPDCSELLSFDGAAEASDQKRHWWRLYVHPEDQPRALEAIEQAVRDRHVLELEHRVRRVGGAVGWTMTRAVPVLDDSGAIKEWFAAASDITARKHAEDALRDADRRKDVFLATLAHELRNPLAPIRNGLQIVRIASHSEAGIQRTLEMMDRQLTHLVRLVDDLLDISRINAGKINLQRQVIDLAKVLISSAESSQSVIDQHGHQLQIDFRAEEVLVDGDFERLAQVFSNLLSNAAKYTERGGRICLRLTSGGGEAVVEVSDTGIGIPREDLPYVFDLFSQVRDHQERAEGGLGIGLALVKSLVSLHGGTVSARSAGLGAGSIFTVRLPTVAATLKGRSGRGATAPAQQVARRRILVADDNVDAADSLAALLALDGHQTSVAYDGVQAVEQVRSFEPDCVILDLGMPRLDGLQVARQIRAMPGGRDMLLVALTGRGQDSDQRRTREAGFDRHLVKPVDRAALVDVLQADRQNAERPYARA